MRGAFAVVGVWLAILTAVAVTKHGQSVGETSCGRVVHQYLHEAAQGAGFVLSHEHLIACHQDGNVAVARVEFDATSAAYGVTQHEVLAVRLVKSPWWAADAHVVG